MEQTLLIEFDVINKQIKQRCELELQTANMNLSLNPTSKDKEHTSACLQFAFINNPEAEDFCFLQLLNVLHYMIFRRLQLFYFVPGQELNPKS